MRNRKKSARIILFVVAFFSVMVLISCGTTPEERRGSLSDAMGKSKDSNKGNRSVPGEENPDYGNGSKENPSDGLDDQPVDATPETAVSLSSMPGDVFFGFRSGRNLVSSGDMGADFDFDLIAGLSMQNIEGMLYAGFKIVDPVDGSSLDESVQNSLGFLRIGGELRWLPFEGRTLLSPYLGGGIGIFMMGWTFANALNDGSEKIESDSLTGVVFSAAAGVYLVRNTNFSLGVSIIPEVYLYDGVTNQGFDNDYFNPYGTVKLMGELLFR